MKLRATTKARVLARAHEIEAPAFKKAMALTLAWQEAYLKEQDYRYRLGLAKKTIYQSQFTNDGKKQRFKDGQEVTRYISTLASIYGFDGEFETVHHNLYHLRLSPVEVLEINTFDHGDYKTIFSIRVLTIKED